MKKWKMKSFASLSEEERLESFNELADVMRALERDVEWTLSDYMDLSEVNALLCPIRNAVNKKLKECMI